MKLSLFKIACIILTLSSCHSVQKENNQTETKIAVEIDGSEKIRFSDIFEQVEYIPLETTDSSLIGTVERLRIFDDQVCLLCDKSLLIFNKQTGHAELQLSKFGGAPEEYQSLYDVYFINNFSINKECVLLSFFLDKKCFWSIYTITNGVNYVGNILEDDVNLLSGTNIDNLNTLFATDKEALYFLLSSDQFIEMCKNNDKFSKMLVSNNITEQSNPLLVKCTFKKKL